MLKKLSAISALVIIAAVLFALPVSAHVSVKPETSAVGSWETYTVKVPSEKEIPTTKVALQIPKGASFEQYQPVPGWKVTTQKQGSNVTTVIWTATGEGIKAGEFQQFSFVVKNQDQTGEAAWNAYQTYKDGSVVEWTGNESADTPHAITKIVKATSSTDSHGAEQPTKGTDDKQSHNTIAIISLVVSIIALVLALNSMIMAIRKKK